MSAYRRILAAVDGSAAAKRGLREAIRLAKVEGAELVILHVVDEFHAYALAENGGFVASVHGELRRAGQVIVDKALALARRGGVEAKIVLREVLGGSVAAQIVREAKKQRSDLIVLGTHGRRGIGRLVLGSDAEEVVRRAPVPVLLVRA
jgi:nucleotide-binding universal stress UspA family protein